MDRKEKRENLSASRGGYRKSVRAAVDAFLLILGVQCCENVLQRPARPPRRREPFGPQEHDALAEGDAALIARNYTSVRISEHTMIS